MNFPAESREQTELVYRSRDNSFTARFSGKILSVYVPHFGSSRDVYFLAKVSKEVEGLGDATSISRKIYRENLISVKVT